jgi:hypothetical protein
MAHDVFISYSSSDKSAADAVVAGLEQKGIRCWVAPRDLTPGISWGQGIADAIEASKVMVVILSQNSNQSRQVAREVERAISKEVTIIPLRIENIDPTGAIAYFLASEHWLDAITPPLERHIDKLGNAIKVFLSDREEPTGNQTPAIQSIPQGERNPEKASSSLGNLSTKSIILGLLVIFILCVAGIVTVIFTVLPRLKDTPSTDLSPGTEAISEGMTATPTSTETLVPTPIPPTATFTLEPTAESTITPEPTESSQSSIDLPPGWIEHTSDAFSIELPDDWEVVDIDQEGMDAMMDLIAEFDSSWADTIESTYGSGSVTPPIFFAMDTKMVGMGYPNININKETLPIPLQIEDVCEELIVIYDQMGLDIVEFDCTLNINDLNAAKFKIEMTIGTIMTQQYQYLYLDNLDFWSINFTVDQSGWSEYEPLFVEIANTFTIID